MTAIPQGNLGVQLGERLFELGVVQAVAGSEKSLHKLRFEQGVLVVVDNHDEEKARWGVARPDMPWKVFLKEVLP